MTPTRIAERLSRSIEDLNDVISWIDHDDDAAARVRHVSADLFELRLEIERREIFVAAAT
jgi:hypothetical protein